MVSKNNLNERLRKMEPKKERFSIRKYTIGAVSVLLGALFLTTEQGNSVNAATSEKSDELSPHVADESAQKVNQQHINKVVVEKSASSAKTNNVQSSPQKPKKNLNSESTNSQELSLQKSQISAKNLKNSLLANKEASPKKQDAKTDQSDNQWRVWGDYHVEFSSNPHEFKAGEKLPDEDTRLSAKDFIKKVTDKNGKDVTDKFDSVKYGIVWRRFFDIPEEDYKGYSSYPTPEKIKNDPKWKDKYAEVLKFVRFPGQSKENSPIKGLTEINGQKQNSFYQPLKEGNYWVTITAYGYNTDYDGAFLANIPITVKENKLQYRMDYNWKNPENQPTEDDDEGHTGITLSQNSGEQSIQPKFEARLGESSFEEVTLPDDAKFTLAENTPAINFIRINENDGSLIVDTNKATAGVYNVPITMTSNKVKDGKTTINKVVVIKNDAHDTVVWGKEAEDHSHSGIVIIKTEPAVLHSTSDSSIKMVAKTQEYVGEIPIDQIKNAIHISVYRADQNGLMKQVSDLNKEDTDITFAKDVPNSIDKVGQIDSEIKLKFAHSSQEDEALNWSSLPQKVVTMPITFVSATAKKNITPIEIPVNYDSAADNNGKFSSDHLEALVDHSALDNLPEAYKVDHYSLANADNISSNPSRVGQSQDAVVRIYFADKTATGKQTYLDVTIPKAIKVTAGQAGIFQKEYGQTPLYKTTVDTKAKSLTIKPGPISNPNVHIQGFKIVKAEKFSNLSDGAIISIDKDGTITIPADQLKYTKDAKITLELTFADGTTAQTTARVIEIKPKGTADKPVKDPHSYNETIKDFANLDNDIKYQWDENAKPDIANPEIQKVNLKLQVPGVTQPVTVTTYVKYTNVLDNANIAWSNDQTTIIKVDEPNYHKTSNSNVISTSPKVVEFIIYDKQGKEKSDYQLSTDGQSYVDENGNQINANEITTSWSKGRQIDTQFTNTNSEKHYLKNAAEVTVALGTNAAKLIGTDSAKSNVYAYYHGATAKQNIPVNVGEKVPTTSRGIAQYLDQNDFTIRDDALRSAAEDWNDVTSLTWQRRPGSNGKFDDHNLSGVIRFNFADSSYLDVEPTFKVGKKISAADHSDQTNPLYAKTHLTACRTIKYATPAGEKKIKDQTQVVNYVRDGYEKLDENTGKPISGQYVWGKWQVANGSEVAFPEKDVNQIPGYDSYVDGVRQKKVAAAAVSTNKDSNGYLTPINSVVKVTYLVQDRSVKINFIDNNDHAHLVDSQTISGKAGTGKKIGLDGKNHTTKLAVPDGWRIVGQTPTFIPFNGDPKDNPDINVYVEKIIVQPETPPTVPTPKPVEKGKVTINYVTDAGKVVGTTSVEGEKGKTIDVAAAISGNLPSGYKLSDNYTASTEVKVGDSLDVAVVSINKKQKKASKKKPKKPSAVTHHHKNSVKKHRKTQKDWYENYGVHSQAMYGQRAKHGSYYNNAAVKGQALGFGNSSNSSRGMNGENAVNASVNNKNARTLPQTGNKKEMLGMVGLAIIGLTGLITLVGDRRRRH